MPKTAVQRSETLETTTYAHAIKVALRRCGLFLKKGSDRDRVVAIVFPPDAVFESYEVALGKVLTQSGLAQRYAITRIVLNKRGQTFAADAVLEVSRGEGVIVIVEHGAVIPQEVLVAVDGVVAVGGIKPFHLVAAAKEVWGAEVPLEAARALCAHSPKLVFLAMRRGRPIDVVLRKLAQPEGPAKGRWEPHIEDLEGYGPAKAWALDMVQDLAAWKKGQISWRDVDAGLLLSGPPGTGKTLFASALARSCGATFIPASCAKWQSKGHLGDMLGAMRASFKDALDQAPTVLLIDEIDSIGDRATFRGDNAGYSMQVVNALLELLDGAESREGVVVIAATNNPAHVDPALRRPGRLDRQIVLELPDRAARAKILATHLGDRIPREELKDISVALSGYSGAHIEQLARSAKRIARRAGRDVQLKDLLELVPPTLPLQGDALRSVCVHEAGHALVGMVLEVGTLDMIVVARDSGQYEDSYGHVQWTRPKVHNRNRQSYLNEIAMLLGGMAAERVHLGTEYDGSGGGLGSDLQQAVDLATRMLSNLGLEALQFHHATTSMELDELRRSDSVIRRRVERLLREQLERAEQIVRERRNLMEALVAILKDREVILGTEVMKLFRDNPGSGSAA
ncbi:MULTISPECIES: AAA family ATPase [Agrobacterium tumefaciens complex]|uniref:AAA ATPase central domain protein n=1 Tax=Agrobacterium tomkonis CFBP 6623 TaxID=1183432 RepID=A0A1S7P1W0_9HYPH|nr:MULTISPECIES: AAA family ATPase [Agrobacterium tumefaciens complex]QCL88993.1 AAA family ATPase [Agrobacterium tumefaciens]CUX14768.1 AAA ATPase central domain protein [Agrobacterium tomkonis CFBP 6623]